MAKVFISHRGSDLSIAERRYRELTLRSVSNLDPAGLPDTRSRLAVKPDLRRLYVPLRIKTVIAADHAAPAADLAELENRRSPVGERLAAARRLVILGDPGAGKSTLLRWLATAYLLQASSLKVWAGFPDIATLRFEHLLPVLVSCGNLDAASLAGSLHDVLRHTLRRTEMGESETEALLAGLDRWLKRGEALLLFDGLDAIGDLRDRARFARQIEQVALAYPRARIVVTSRPAGYRELGFRLGRGFEHTALAELTREEKESFVHRWYGLMEPDPEHRPGRTAELIRAIRGNHRIDRLAGNPMLLTTMALVIPQVPHLPQRRADLFGEVIQTLLQWPADPGGPLDVRESLPQLEYLAYALCDRGEQQLPESEIFALLDALRGELPEGHPVRAHSAADLLRFVAENTGLLRRAGERRHQGMDVPVFEFCHPAFQEYLAARALVDGHFPGREPGLTLAEKIRELTGRTAAGPNGDVTILKHWQEPIRLCIACMGHASEALAALLRPLPGEAAGMADRARAVLAALCLADGIETGEATAREILASLARHAGRKDGNALWPTSLDEAVLALADSRWVEPLKLALVRELLARGAEERWSLGFVFKLLVTRLAMRGESVSQAELTPIVQPPPAPEEEGVALALEVMASTFVAGVADVATPAERAGRLLPLLAGRPAAAHAAAWALYSLLGRHQEAGAWRPTAAELDRIAELVARPDLDAGAAWCLIKILGQTRTASAAGPLTARLEDPSPSLRRAAEEALQRITGG
ncbi:MAG TPA: NACHT domain-containing protein [Thermoanaerobaculia bacterium]|nr:NACHT domain-containing protein [Thermoanaerobaculia bacterium]